MHPYDVEYECNKCGTVSIYSSDCNISSGRNLCETCVDNFLRQHCGTLSLTLKQKRAFGHIDDDGNLTSLGKALMRQEKKNL